MIAKDEQSPPAYSDIEDFINFKAKESEAEKKPGEFLTSVQQRRKLLGIHRTVFLEKKSRIFGLLTQYFVVGIYFS